MLPEGTSKLSPVRPTLVRKVNADDKRQAAELIELDGGELRREPLDTRKATFGVAGEAGRARTCASTSGPAARGCGRLRIASTAAPQEREVQRARWAATLRL
jgi:hypothetical protein